MPVVHQPKYILRLDDLPKIVEADGTVYPVFLTLRDAARLFGVTPDVLLGWSEKYDLPVLKVGRGARGGRFYIEIAKFNDWIAAHSRPRHQHRPDEIDGEDLGGDE